MTLGMGAAVLSVIAAGQGGLPVVDRPRRGMP